MSSVNGLVAPTTAIPASSSPISNPGDVLVIDGYPCFSCFPTSAGYNPPVGHALDDNGNTVATIDYFAAQVLATSTAGTASKEISTAPTKTTDPGQTTAAATFTAGVIASAGDSSSQLQSAATATTMHRSVTSVTSGSTMTTAFKSVPEQPQSYMTSS